MEAEIARLAESGDTLFTVTDQENTIVGLVIGAKAGKELGECNLGKRRAFVVGQPPLVDGFLNDGQELGLTRLHEAAQ